MHENGKKLGEIAGAQWSAGLIREAAATFEEAFAATMADTKRTQSDLAHLAGRIAYHDHGSELVAVSPTLGVRLLEAAETVPEGIGRAELLSAIARVLPN